MNYSRNAQIASWLFIAVNCLIVIGLWDHVDSEYAEKLGSPLERACQPGTYFDCVYEFLVSEYISIIIPNIVNMLVLLTIVYYPMSWVLIRLSIVVPLTLFSLGILGLAGL